LRIWRGLFGWCEALAVRGDAAGQHALGACYFHGEGVSRHVNEAVEWYRWAAECGHARAQLRLGRVLFEGGNPALGVRWFCTTAEQGVVDGQLVLAHCYEAGVGGVGKDREMAIVFFLLALTQGDSHGEPSLRTLGVLP